MVTCGGSGMGRELVRRLRQSLPSSGRRLYRHSGPALDYRHKPTQAPLPCPIST